MNTAYTKILTFILFFTISFPSIAERQFETDIIKETFKYGKNSKKSIPLSELNQGCPKIDCIPAIDNPEFVSINKADFIHDEDIMMLVEYNGVKKVYPRKIMQVHEIVNDYYGDKPLAMTYCPLCGTSVAFIPIIDGQRVELGVSGVLHSSDLVMYDRKTKSLWGQITGRAIVGPKTGERLKIVSSGLMKWSEVKQTWSDAMVLQQPQKDSDRYDSFRYQKYVESEKLMFPVAVEDARLPSKTVVYGIEIDGAFIAFEEEYLKKRTPMIESFGKRTLKVSYQNGKAIAVDKKTKEQFNVLRVYWFAWYAFHPETQLRN